MPNFKTVFVVMPARNEEIGLPELINEIFSVLSDGRHEVHIVLAVNNSTLRFQEFCDTLSREKGNLHVLQLGDLGRKSFAYAYLSGMKFALDLGAEAVVEMDATGAHDPCYLPGFLETLKIQDAALSSRFTNGGSISQYPLQRFLVSWGGTLLANLLLGFSRWMPDATSGYEAFRAETLKAVFAKYPVEEWISVTRGPGHLYQTEMRAYLEWLGASIGYVGITWGAGRVKKPNTLGLGYLLKAWYGLRGLQKRRKPKFAKTPTATTEPEI